MPLDSSETTQTSFFDVPPPSEEEIEQLLNDIQLAQARVDSIIQSGQFSSSLFENLPSEIEAISEDPAKRELINTGQFELAASTQPLTQDLLESEAASIEAGSRIDPQTEQLIDSVFESQFEAGVSDINQALTNTLEIIRDELAPALGLRPEDTPILDRAARVAAETVRQTGQLRSQLDSSAATAKLNFPLQQDALTSERTARFAGISGDATDFSDQLQQQAFLNRQLLVEQAGNFGLNVAQATGASPGVTATNLGRNRASLAPETISVSSSGTNFSDLASGIGGLLEGIDAITN